jgi:hypothetical protein
LASFLFLARLSSISSLWVPLRVTADFTRSAASVLIVLLRLVFFFGFFFF